MSPNLECAAPTTKYPLWQLRAHAFCKATDAFLRTPGYFLLVGFLTVLAAVCSMELVTYTCFIIIAVFVALLGSDLLPLIPLVVLSYISPSVHNNPGLNGESVFSGENGVYILSIAAVFAVCLIIRLIADPEMGIAFLKRKRSLLSGMVILGVAYMLAGAFSGYYTASGWRNALFGFVQFISIFLCYFLFTGGIRWEKVPKNYLAWCGICVGLVVLAQLGYIYLVNHVVVDGKIDRGRIFSGWGTYNNIGALLVMTIPFAFQLACRKKGAWVFEIVALLLLGGVVMTCSRGSLLAAAIVYLTSCGLMFYKALRSHTFRLVHTIVAIVVIPTVILFRHELMTLFDALLQRGLDPSGRDVIYKEGFKQFLRFPVFGGSFFPVDFIPYGFSSVAEFTAIFPPRWHNTIVQLLATCGITGLLAYGFHRYQTIRMMLKTPTTGKLFICLSLLALLGTSLVDCHFFNIGPTLFYSIALAFAEKADTQVNE